MMMMMNLGPTNVNHFKQKKKKNYKEKKFYQPLLTYGID